MKASHPRNKCLAYRTFPFILLLFIFFSASGSAVAQKKPDALRLDANTDDKEICSGQLSGSQFCDFFRAYNLARNSGDAATAQAIRNEMIDLVKGQVDTYYKLRKDGRKTKIRWLQTLLDFLEIGTATAITIMNGERAKTVVGAALNGFQGGRSAFNKNFEILQTQVLINKMNTNRAEIFAEIVLNKDRTIADYSWYAAKNDLRRYLFAGTFNNALDTLVNETGADVVNAEANLREVETRRIVGATTAQNLQASESGKKGLEGLDAALKKTDTRDTALKILRGIVIELNKDEQLKQLLEAKEIKPTSEGAPIIKGLLTIRRELTIVGKDDLVKKINDVITRQAN